MKNIKNHLIALFILMLTLPLSCGSSHVSNTENALSDNAELDPYSVLREGNKEPKRIQEDLSGAVIVLTEKDFIEKITSLDNPKGFQYLGQTPCIVELYADWCKPCGLLSELLRNLAPKYQGKVIFYKLNVDRATEVTTAFKVKEIPKILYFKPHAGVSSTVGYLNREQVISMIDKFLLNP